MSKALADLYADQAHKPTLSVNDSLAWTIPLMKEYAGKLHDFCDRCQAAWEKLLTDKYLNISGIESGRLLYWYNTTVKEIEKIVRQASGLLEHSSFEFEIETELRLRIEEIEVHLRLAHLLADELNNALRGKPAAIDYARKAIGKVALNATF